jgi:hypothetical protein
VFRLVVRLDEHLIAIGLIITHASSFSIDIEMKRMGRMRCTVQIAECAFILRSGRVVIVVVDWVGVISRREETR